MGDSGIVSTGVLDRNKLSLVEYEEYLRRRTQPNTAITYIVALRDWFTWLDGREPSKETAQEFIDHLESHGKAQNTVATKANAIKRWFKWRGEPILLDSPGIYIPPPEYVTLEQLDQLINACRTPLERVLIIGLFDTACRPSEWLGIELDGIDHVNKLVKVVGKGGREAWVNISDRGLDALDEWLGSRKSSSKRVFMDLTYRDMWVTIKSVGRKAKIPVRPHMFRHSRAIHMLEAGAEPHIVQQHLRHRSITTTLNIYGQYLPMHLKKKIPEW